MQTYLDRFDKHAVLDLFGSYSQTRRFKDSRPVQARLHPPGSACSYQILEDTFIAGIILDSLGDTYFIPRRMSKKKWSRNSRYINHSICRPNLRQTCSSNMHPRLKPNRCKTRWTPFGGYCKPYDWLQAMIQSLKDEQFREKKIHMLFRSV